MESKKEFIGIIPDGNRRKVMADENLPSVKDLSREQLLLGYHIGACAVRSLIEEARELSIGIIATWGMSENNMEKRTSMERGVLYEVFTEFLTDLRDNWVDRKENKAVRFAHMGRRDRLQEEAPHVLGLLDEISQHTRSRLGMVVAVCLDYDGRRETKRATKAWCAADSSGDWEDYLDLPSQGVPFQELDLLIRTGEDGGRIKHSNSYLLPYQGDGSSLIFHETLLPEYTPQMLRDDVTEYRQTQRRKGA